MVVAGNKILHIKQYSIYLSLVLNLDFILSDRSSETLAGVVRERTKRLPANGQLAPQKFKGWDLYKNIIKRMVWFVYSRHSFHASS